MLILNIMKEIVAKNDSKNTSEEYLGCTIKQDLKTKKLHMGQNQKVLRIVLQSQGKLSSHYWWPSSCTQQLHLTIKVIITVN